MTIYSCDVSPRQLTIYINNDVNEPEVFEDSALSCVAPDVKVKLTEFCDSVSWWIEGS